MILEECEQIQENLRTFLDDQPDILITKLCQVVVDFYNQQPDKEIKDAATN